MPAETEIELAQHYVALSNAHDLSAISGLFAAEARYRSTAVGEYQGQEAIVAMMRTFFQRFPDVRWTVEHYRAGANGGVVFDFFMEATSAAGERVVRRGRERLEFDTSGQIVLVEVAAT